MQNSLWVVVCRLILISLFSIALVPICLSAQDYPAASEQEDQPQYPGIPPSKGKLEGTIGSYNLRLYGTVLLNIQASDTPPIGGDVPLWASPSSSRAAFLDQTVERIDDVHDLTFTARQSVFGLMVKPAETSGGAWQPSAKLEFDLFGTRPVDTLLPQGRVLNQPRLRFAYLQLSRGSVKITAGQDKAIIAPLDPVSLSHVAIPLGATAGNLWAWLPQVRVDATRKVGNGSLLFQGGVLRPQFADPRIGDFPPLVGSSLDTTPGFGERATQPFYQSRVAYSHPMNGSNLTVGAGGHYGRERIGVDRTLDSWAFAIDYSVPILPRITWRGENFVGSNLVPFGGGVLQGVAFLQPVNAPPTPINRIGAGGGWTELIIKATADNKNVFYTGVGEDDPRDKHLLSGTTRSRNAFAWASYFRRVGDNTTVGLEWSNWQFKTRGTVNGVPGPQGPSGTANVFNLALAYQF